MSTEAPKPKDVLLFGGTGVIGKYILAALIKSKASFGKIGIFTSNSTAQSKAAEIASIKEKGVEVIVGDVNREEDVLGAYKGFDTVVSALGRGALLTQIPLIRLAEASPSVHTFYPSEYGTDIEYGPSSATEKPHQGKLAVRKFIREEIKRLRITYLVTGPYSDLYIGKSPMPEAGSFDVKARKAVVPGTGDEKVSFTTMTDVGTLLVAALLHPSSASPRVLKVNSFTVTAHEIVAELEKQIGSKWEVSYTPLDKYKELEKQAWEKGNPMATVLTLRRIWTEGGTLYEKRNNDLIGEPGLESLESQVSKAIKQQTADGS